MFEVADVDADDEICSCGSLSSPQPTTADHQQVDRRCSLKTKEEQKHTVKSNAVIYHTSLFLNSQENKQFCAIVPLVAFTVPLGNSVYLKSSDKKIAFELFQQQNNCDCHQICVRGDRESSVHVNSQMLS